MKKLSRFLIITTLFISSFTTFIGNNYASEIDLSNSKILKSEELSSLQGETYVRVLQEEIEKRTGIKISQVSNWSSKNLVITLCYSSSEELEGRKVPKCNDRNFDKTKSEGFRLFFDNKTDQNVLWIIGNDNRGILFGIGELLRRLEMSKGRIVLSTPVDFSSVPVYPIRGHQLGYRNTANSYDAWSVEQYEQYIRELAFFGSNSIENIPIGSEGDKTDISVHFKLSREKMNIELGNICNAYDIDYWVWTPATIDLRIDSLRQIELERHEKFYKECPRLDNVFFPGGDPGHNHPSEVMPYLKDLHSILQKYHPEAGIWISLQGFSEEQVDYFYNYLDENEADWLSGVVSGPSSPPIAETRFRLDKKYGHRQYPDITHNVRCEFPALNFDQAFALTIGREGINPQPVYYAKIYGDYAQFTDGFIAYSDGCHDDVNKVIWSMRAWNPNKSVREILIEYGRFFFGPDIAIQSAEGILGLEQNWIGPLKSNGSVETTYAFWKELERSNPQLTTNWRWLMLQLRADYDTYTRRRVLSEKKLEKQANKILENVDELGIDETMKLALKKINEADTNPIDENLKASILKYCEDLFQIIGLQTSVELYQASNSQRGCILDFVDYPMNNRWWYEDEFKKIDEMKTEQEKMERLEIIRTWENPGPGSYYDDISNIANSPRVTTTVYDAVDFGWWDSGYSRMRLSSQVYQNDPILEYKDLDPNGRYILRITGYGDALLRIDGIRMEPTHYNKEVEEFKEFVVPRRLIGDGEITLTFDRPEESHIRWKFYSRISDVWLIKK